MQKASVNGKQSLCLNGPDCSFLKKGKCLFRHSPKDRPENLAGKTRYLKNQAQELSGLVSSLSIKVAALERIICTVCTTYPGLLQAFGEQDQWIVHLVQNQFKIEQQEALVSTETSAPVRMMMASFAEGEQKLAQYAANQRFKFAEKKPDNIKDKVLRMAGTNDESIIKKIWADLNPPTYLRPTLPRLKLPRLCRDMERGRVVFSKAVNKWQVKAEVPGAPPNARKQQGKNKRQDKMEEA